MQQRNYEEPRLGSIRMRVNETEKKLYTELTKKLGYKTISDLLRDCLKEKQELVERLDGNK